MENQIRKELAEHRAVMTRLEEELVPAVAGAAEELVAGLAAGRCLFAMGNGGSAADCQHLVAELVGRFRLNRPPLPAFALVGDAAVMTALGNDYPPEELFARQIRALVRPGDLVVAVSTSGRSPNVVAGAGAAREAGGVVVGLLGGDGGLVAPLCNRCVVVPSSDTARIQEGHGLIIHLWCSLIERALYP